MYNFTTTRTTIMYNFITTKITIVYNNITTTIVYNFRERRYFLSAWVGAGVCDRARVEEPRRS